MSDVSEGNRRRDRHNRRGRGRSSRQGEERSSANKTGDGRGNSSQVGTAKNQGSPYSAGSREPQRNSGRQKQSPGQRDSGGSSRQRSPQNGGREPRRERREEIIPLPVLPTPQCARCGQPIQDVTSALADRESGSPIHFDCAIEFLQGAENIKPEEKIVYIGQGRFAVMVFETPSDLRKFKIVRTIEWEKRETKAEWRADIAGQFSQIS